MNNLYSFSCTELGQSHILSKKPCQDYSSYFENSQMNIAVVSDGHGSSNFTRSDRGSKFACESAIAAAKEFVECIDEEQLKSSKSRNMVVEQLCKNILLRWNNAVNADYLSSPMTEEEVQNVSDKYRTSYLNGEKYEHAYGCTLIIIIFTRNYFLAIRNGDGQCVTVNTNALFEIPIPWNEKCEFNVTTSLCDNMAIEDFRYYYTEDLPVAAFVGSDGVDDSYTSVEELYNLYRALCIDAINDGVEVMKENIISFLPGLTQRGSTDDVSIAGTINEIALKKISKLIIEDNEKRKRIIEAEKAKRIEAMKKREREELEKKLKKLQDEKSCLSIKASNMIKEREELVSKSFFFKSNADKLLNEIESIEKKLSDIDDRVSSIYNKLTENGLSNPVSDEECSKTEIVDMLSDGLESESNNELDNVQSVEIDEECLGTEDIVDNVDIFENFDENETSNVLLGEQDIDLENSQSADMHTEQEENVN